MKRVIDLLEKVVLGIDPGAKGALTIMDLQGKVLQVIDFISYHVTTEDIKILAQDFSVQAIAIEHVKAAPDQGRTGIFNFGTNFGYWHGIAYSLFDCPVLLPYPQTWQAKRILKKTKDCPKPSLPLAREEYPCIDLGLQMHADRADSIYIADWCRLQWLAKSDEIIKEWENSKDKGFKPIRFKKRFGIDLVNGEIASEENWEL